MRKTAPSPRQARQLPQDLVRLIHHVELHKSGWWNRALERLVLVTLWLQSVTTIDEVVEFLSQNLAGRLQRDQIEGEVERLRSSGVVLTLPDGRIKIAEESNNALCQELADVSDSEDRVRKRFQGLAKSSGMGELGEKLWQDFEDLFLLPLVREAGARTYEVVSSTADVDFAIRSYGDIARPLLEKYGTDFKDLIVQFLDPSDTDVRAYVLRRLNAHFLVEACALDANVLDNIATSDEAKASKRARVFLDTNFLFSILSLHDNPANETARDLLRIIEQAERYVGVQLYVIPITVEETRRVLRDVIARLSGITLRKNLAMAASGMTSSGLVTRYVEAATAYESGVLTADDFFGPYESGLIAILKDRGVDLYNEDLTKLRLDQDVIDDIHHQEEVQTSSRGQPKSYNANLHDMVLWHFAQRLRSRSPSAQIDFDSSVATVDFGLIAFDRYRRRLIGGSPICITPSALIQVLQFWIPKTEELERAIVGSFREPLLFLEFDRATEQTTIRILRELSRFEGIDDLSPHTLYGILKDNALRARLGTSPSMESGEVVELVEAAVVKEARKLEAELQAVDRQRQDELAKAVSEARALSEVLKARQVEIGQLETKINSLEDERANKDTEVRDLEGELESLQNRIHVVEQQSVQQQKVRDRWLLLSATVGSALPLTAGAFFGAKYWIGRASLPDWLIWSSASTCAAMIWLGVSDYAMRTRPSFQSHWAHRLVSRCRGWLFSGMTATALAIAASAIWDAIS